MVALSPLYQTLVHHASANVWFRQKRGGHHGMRQVQGERILLFTWTCFTAATSGPLSSAAQDGHPSPRSSFSLTLRSNIASVAPAS